MKWPGKWAIAVVAALLAGIVAVLLLREDEAIEPRVAAPASETVPSPILDPLPVASETAAVKVPPPSVDKTFLRRARTADIRRALRDPDLPTNVSDALLQGGLANAVRLLEPKAARGDADANATLARLWQMRDRRGTGDDADVPRQRRPSYLDGLVAECTKAGFDSSSIDRRLQDFANDGHAASLHLLAERTEGEARRKLLTSAALLGHSRAQIQLALLLSPGVNMDGRISNATVFWWSAAAAKEQAAAVYLAHCRARGCDGKPADEEAGLAQLRAAAQLGSASALLYLTDSLFEFPAEIPVDERYAWLDFNHNLWLLGCKGELTHPFDEIEAAIAAQGKSLSPYALASGKKLAAAYWEKYSAGAQRALRCE